MRTFKELNSMLSELSADSQNKLVVARNMYDSKLITYKEYIVLREYILDNNL